MTRERKVHVASLRHWLDWPTMAVHLESEIRVPWDPIHDVLPRWRMADDPAFIAFKPAAEHSEA